MVRANNCDDEFRIIALVLGSGNGVDGSIPAELELLSDLEVMIASEVYVSGFHTFPVDHEPFSSLLTSSFGVAVAAVCFPN
jgi:hypothetical protein